eukprot:TRINITY_DN9758_c0_g1_i1.p1 TRINITY_DN9758_c0_g1~~TRINITY_DN9758_c0_g1_i1.p1  ORF type:complete len:347 (+),score=153.80 TRINITY_DN9758_c0_g1_i1:101-1042(+)
MLGERYKKMAEARERRAKEARVKKYVGKRSKMHWGVYSAGDGAQQECKHTTCMIKVKNNAALVELTYRYACKASAVEYYFPICEVGRLKSIQIQWKQGGADAPLQVMDGELYEQTADGVTQPWKEDETASVADSNDSESAPLFSSLFGAPSEAGTEGEKKKDDGSAFFYFFGTSPGLREVRQGEDIIVKVFYSVGCKSERQQFEDKDTITFTMPLTIFSQVPNKWDISVEMYDFIRRIRPKLPSQKLLPEIKGKKATVSFHELGSISLEDLYFSMNIELGEPIEPRCADPVALFIFATFFGLMLWFTLTKHLH